MTLCAMVQWSYSTSTIELLLLIHTRTHTECTGVESLEFLDLICFLAIYTGTHTDTLAHN